MAAPFVFIWSIVCFAHLSGGHVIELDDRFTEASKQGKWLVEFYAPWCGHCQSLMPTWSEVGQQMIQFQPQIRVARLDGTRFGGIMDLYNVRGFPTIMYIEGERQYTHRGGRTSKDIIDFGMRAEGPAVRKLKDQAHFRQVQKENEVIFTIIAEDDSSDTYKFFSTAAEDKILDSYFYHSPMDAIPEKSRPEELPALLVFKDGTHHVFEEEVTEENIAEWVVQEIIPAFPKFTSDNLYNLFKGGKTLVIVLTFPSASNAKKHPHYLMRETLKEAAIQHRDKYHKKYQFVYMEDKSFMQELVLSSLEIPTIIAFDPKTYLYYLMEDPVNVNHESLADFLASVEDKSIRGYGGNGFFRRVYRVFYEIFTSLGAMWSAQPILTSLLLGLPSLLISFVCYSLCTAEPAEEGGMDSEDEGIEGMEDGDEESGDDEGGHDEGGHDEGGHIKVE